MAQGTRQVNPPNDWPQVTRADHQAFCLAEGWEQVRNARGGTGSHHVTYRLVLPNGSGLRTRISHPVDGSTYGPGLWATVRSQLAVSDEEFWACVRDGILPDRGVPSPRAEPLPSELVYMLHAKVGLADAEIGKLTRDQAIARLHEYWTTGS